MEFGDSFRCVESSKHEEGIGHAGLSFNLEFQAVLGQQNRNVLNPQIGKLRWRAVTIFQMPTSDDADDQSRRVCLKRSCDIAGKRTVPGLLGPNKSIELRIVRMLSRTFRP